MKKLFQAAVAAVAAIRFMAAHALRAGLVRALVAREALASCLPPADGRAPCPTSFLTATRGLPRATPRKAGAGAGGRQTLLAAIRDLVRRLRCQSILHVPDAPPAATHSTAGATARHALMRK